MLRGADQVIVETLLHFFPDWPAPARIRPTGWTRCLCPNPDHPEARPSAAINLELNAVKCQACGFKGDAISIIMGQRKVGYREAVRYAEEVISAGGDQVPRSTTRKRSRPVFGGTGAAPGQD